MKREEGSVTVELVLLAPILMTLMLFVVYAGRGAEVLTQIQHAADQGEVSCRRGLALCAGVQQAAGGDNHNQCRYGGSCIHSGHV